MQVIYRNSPDGSPQTGEIHRELLDLVLRQDSAFLRISLTASQWEVLAESAQNAVRAAKIGLYPEAPLA